MTGYNPEVAASFSSGSFSVYFPRPPYQSNFVPSFLRNLGNQYHSFYKRLQILQRLIEWPSKFSIRGMELLEFAL
ncbi:hypothetical protein EDB85DRAFT_2010880 [Lactarius pseudohatsudake]|nr:hypothetical protein EDB85DRAFT_2010880 [Lactarius pseudohatsudake]